MSEIVKRAFENIDPKAKKRVEKMIKEGKTPFCLIDTSKQSKNGK